ncbi:MAG TPA: outer membrane protein assembly factor BamD [Nannocystaceae bacterium]|nr:outer membrane protein assembly factor BamD [Nannocystaceae bacterium]
MNGLSPAAKALLADYAAHTDALAGDGQAGWPALARRIDRADEPLPIDEPAIRGSRRAIAAIAVVLVAAAAVVVAWLAGATQLLARSDDAGVHEAAYGAASESNGGAATIRDDAPARPRAIEAAEKGARTRVVAAAAAATGGDGDEAVIVDASEPTILEAAPAPRTRPRPQPATDDLEEVRTIATARAALRDGDPRAALKLLHALARAHPKSAYTEEREVLIVAALCRAGRTDDARKAADRFRRVHPRSPLVAHLARSCGESP